MHGQLLRVPDDGGDRVALLQRLSDQMLPRLPGGSQQRDLHPQTRRDESGLERVGGDERTKCAAPVCKRQAEKEGLLRCNKRRPFCLILVYHMIKLKFKTIIYYGFKNKILKETFY